MTRMKMVRKASLVALVCWPFVANAVQVTRIDNDGLELDGSLNLNQSNIGSDAVLLETNQKEYGIAYNFVLPPPGANATGFAIQLDLVGNLDAFDGGITISLYDASQAGSTPFAPIGNILGSVSGGISSPNIAGFIGVGPIPSGPYSVIVSGLIDENYINNDTLAVFGDVQFTAVPVPAAAWLFGSGLVGLAGIARKRRIAA